MSNKTYLCKIDSSKQWFKSCQYCLRFRYPILIFIFLIISIGSKSYAGQKQYCNAEIQNIAVAKATEDVTKRPIAGWHTVKQFPDRWDSRWKNYSGNAWYRIDWNFRCNHQQQYLPMTLLIKRIIMAGQIYINDDLLWQDQSLVEPLSRSWNMPRYWNIPASSLKQGHNILWIRVVGVKTQNAGLDQVLLGSDKEIMPIYNQYWRDQRIVMFFNLIFSLVLSIVAFLIWLFHREEKVFGWFALTSFLWVFFIANTLIIEPPFGLKTLEIARINITLFFCYCICSCLYAWRLAHQKYPTLEKFLFIIAIINTSVAIFIPDKVIEWFLPASFFAAILILFCNFIAFPFIAFKVKQTESYFLAIIFILYLIIAIYDLKSILFPSNNITVIFPYTAPITTLFIAIILAMRLAKNVKRIENFNKTLKENVLQAKEELTTSLNIQHKLALENTKLQERMNLAHDLHDGLGGSLVRSMALIDQSKDNLTNPQFLSMLKLLRDDLRQIIDSGSSSGAKVPETPILWGAAVRYRFMQILDELNIDSSWSFPEVWQSKPTTLECLTLLRVLEESLTNILKHSQATQVKVRVYYLYPTQLILEIEDNGLGFDVNAVLESGISVGIRSMQIRLAKIQADMHIESQAGRTLIQVVKDFKRIRS